MRVDQPGRPARWFTLLRNTGHSNVSHVFTEDQEILPGESTLTVVPGFVGADPTALYAVQRDGLAAFTAAVGARASTDLRSLQSSSLPNPGSPP